MNTEVYHKQHRGIFILVMFTTLTLGSAVDMFVPSLPFISGSLHASAESTRFIVTIYLVAYGIAQLFAGGLADSLGRRKVMIVSLFGFSIASACIPFSPNITTLLILRVVQGVGSAGYGVVSRALLSDTVSGNLLSKRSIYQTVAWGLGVIVSPYVGGYLQHYFDWHASFYGLAIYVFIIGLVTLFWMQETIQQKRAFKLGVLAKGFAEILRSRIFILSALACGLAYGFATTFNVAGPFLIERALNYSPVVYGYIALVLGAGWVAGNFLCRALVGSSKANKSVVLLVLIGLMAAVVQLVLALSGYFNIWTTFAPVVVILLGGGTLFSFCYMRSISLFRQSGGSASAVLGATFSVISGVVSGVASFVESNSLTPLATTFVILVGLALVLFLLSLWSRG